MTTTYISLDEALLIYAHILGITVEQAYRAVRDWNLLESALMRPVHAAAYADADLVDQAASLLWGLVENHAFGDGNKRISYALTLTFLRANGWDVQAQLPDEMALIIGITKDISEADVSRWIRQRLQPFCFSAEG